MGEEVDRGGGQTGADIHRHHRALHRRRDLSEARESVALRKEMAPEGPMPADAYSRSRSMNNAPPRATPAATFPGGRGAVDERRTLSATTNLQDRPNGAGAKARRPAQRQAVAISVFFGVGDAEAQ